MRRTTIILLVLLVGCRGETREEAPVAASPEVEATETTEEGDRAIDRWQPPETAEIPTAPATSDTGVFADMQSKVVLHSPEWVDGTRTIVKSGEDALLFVDGVSVGLAPPNTPAVEAAFGDLDADGLPDQLDILIGAKKAAANNAPYQGGYQKLDFPGGDVPRTEGVCTDVIVRAIRNAGLDLQKELHDEIGRAPRAFPMVKRRDTNIDHRRVKTLLPYFQRRWESRPSSPDQVGDWLPGDIVFMQTMGDSRPDHVGVVSDRLGESGAPLIINNWTTGYATSEMDIARLVPITHRFRLKSTFQVDSVAQGPKALLDRHGVSASDTRQLLVVSAPNWNADTAMLTRWSRSTEWKQVGEPIEVTLGSAGLGLGFGEHERFDAPHHKVEGDRRAPAGVFRLGTAFGREAPGGNWPFRPVKSSDAWVDDPNLSTYNTWVDEPPTGSHEKLSMYDLAIVVEHNTTDVRHGAGSAIFLHTWQGAPAPTLGCTAMKRADLIELIRWLDPEAQPLLVQAVDQVH